jgi:putative membrane protein
VLRLSTGAMSFRRHAAGIGLSGSAFCLYLISNIGNWNYKYRAHRKCDSQSGNDAFDILSERYARGEINENEYFKMKADIAK